MREIFTNLFENGDSRDKAINNRNNRDVNPSRLGEVTAELVTVRPAQAQTQVQARIDAQPAIATIMSPPQPQETPSSQLQRIKSAQISTGSTDVDQGQEGQGGLGGQGGQGGQGRLGGQGGHGGQGR